MQRTPKREMKRKLKEETVDSGHGTDDEDCPKCKTIVSGIKSSQCVLSMHVDIRSICPSKTKDSSGSLCSKASSPKKGKLDRQQDPEQSEKQKKEKQKRKHKERDRIFERICALRNSRGGILLIHFTHMDDSDQFLGLVDELIDDRLNELIEDGSIFHESYFRDWEKNEPNCLSITCNPSSTISTANYNTHINLNKGFARPTILNMRYILSKDRSCREYKEKSLDELQESSNVQLKSFRNAQNVERDNWALHIMEELRLKEFISSFANQQGGGYYFLGVAEQDDGEIDTYKTRKVSIEGFELNKIHHEKLKSEILDQFVSKMLFLKQDISTIDRDAITKTLKVTFHKVRGLAHTFVLEVYVHPFSGVVFFDRDGPESYRIDENNRIRRVEPQEWCQKILENIAM
ncbi:protein SLFN14-like isoform X1 [Haliotis cracherodii]|uniref:protein SLFN14-like isoform X1 n=1 Tax=Haliotis cracherodii TaxID=6455 RepID=UPI0039ED58A2